MGHDGTFQKKCPIITHGLRNMAHELETENITDSGPFPWNRRWKKGQQAKKQDFLLGKRIP